MRSRSRRNAIIVFTRLMRALFPQRPRVARGEGELG